MTEDKLKDAYILQYPCPKGLEKVSATSSVLDSHTYKNGLMQSDYTKIFTLTVKAAKKGKYTIAPVTVLYNGKKYVAPKVKVNVSR